MRRRDRGNRDVLAGLGECCSGGVGWRGMREISDRRDDEG